jgi:hypothetical protein
MDRLYKYADEHAIPLGIGTKHHLPQDIVNWINTNAQPKQFKFRDDLNTIDDVLTYLGGFPHLPAFTGNSLHYLELDLPYDVPYEKMHKEADSFRQHYVPHRTHYEGHGGWNSLCIHGLSAVQTQGEDMYGFTHPNDSIPYIWTDICKWMPTIAMFFQETFTYDAFERIRIMQLEPGGFIYPHTDSDNHKLGPVNLALNNPDGCKFFMKGRGVVPFKPGQANKLDNGFEHIVFNDSDEYRYHMIIHGIPGPSWDKIMHNSYKKLCVSADE